MERAAFALMVLALASCAAPAGPVTQRSEPAAPAQRPSRAVTTDDALAALQLAGQPDAPDVASVRAFLGAPDIVRQDGRGALMTWRLPSCALVLGFADNRLQAVDASALKAGAPAPALSTCIGEARARQGRVA